MRSHRFNNQIFRLTNFEGMCMNDENFWILVRVDRYVVQRFIEESGLIV